VRRFRRIWLCDFSELHLEAPKDVVKRWKNELRKIVELLYGLIDELVSKGVCDPENVKAIEDTGSSVEHRKKLVDGMVKKLNTNPAQRKQILDILTRNNQHHVTAFIERKGCKYRSIAFNL
jgi:polyhydroxyalkanoate synthesis regulator phasin